MNCNHCQAETSNGLALCEMSRRKASDCCGSLPIYFKNLARWRPGQAGSRQVPSSQEPRKAGRAANDRVSRALDEAGNDLTTWARILADDRGGRLPALLARLGAADLTEAETMAWLCRGLDRYLTSIATLEWCGEFVTRLAEHEATLYELTTEAVPGWYAGGCKRCGSGTYVVPGLSWVTCGGCGVTTFARDHIEAIVDEAADWISTPKRLAETLVALVDTEQSVEDLRKRIAIWGSRDRYPTYRPNEYAVKRYRLGDVLAELTGSAAKVERAS